MAADHGEEADITGKSRFVSGAELCSVENGLAEALSLRQPREEGKFIAGGEGKALPMASQAIHIYQN